MPVLTTERFLEKARRQPGEVCAQLEELDAARELGAGPCASTLPSGAVVAWGSKGTQLALFDVGYPADGQDGDAPLSSLSKQELRALGVPDERIAQVQQVQDVSGLDALGLPDPVAARLRFQLAQQQCGLSAREDELCYQARDLAQLADYLRGDLRRLLLHLDPSQRQIVALGGAGPIIVKGVAGSGKTAVALQRIYESLRARSLLEAPRILLLAYNRSLAVVARELLMSLGLRSDEVEIATLHAWCAAHVPLKTRVVDDRDRRGLIRDAVAEVRQALAGQPGADSALWAHPQAFWWGEIHRIQGAVQGGPDEYLKLPRHGAGRALDGRLRQLVWRVYEAYRARLARHHVRDWDDVVRDALRRVQAMGPQAPRYDQVLVDEAQDLTPMGLRLAAALCKPRGTLFVAFDPDQSIYEHGFRWKSMGLVVHGARSFELRRNFRNTSEILAAAEAVRAQAGAAHEDALAPDRVARQGEPVRLLAVPPATEHRTVARDIARLIAEERVPPQNIAVLCYPNGVRDHLFLELSRADLRCQKHDEDADISLADPSVKVLPMRSAKGLEFPVVYVLATGANFRPPMEGESEQAAWREQMRRCFYVAFTRAMSRLVVVYSEADPVEFLRPLLAR